MRRVAATAIAVTAVALAIAAPAAPAAPAQGNGQNCGTYSSVSIYPKGKVKAIRGVSCREALRVAKKYDHKGRARGPWECVLGHGGRTLFSCGYGGASGDIRDFPHALTVKGVGSPA
ncbi:MAG: hypothetical protein ABW249_06345 [Solirubrobacterales bacterium]